MLKQLLVHSITIMLIDVSYLFTGIVNGRRISVIYNIPHVSTFAVTIGLSVLDMMYFNVAAIQGDLLLFYEPSQCVFALD